MPDSGSTLVVDVGATRTRLARATSGTLADRMELRTAELVAASNPERGIVDRLATVASELMNASDQPPLVAGVSVAAAVEYGGSILQARDFGIPAGALMRETLENALGLPVAIDNDANCAALAEQQLGAASGCDWVAVLTLGTNIGMGLILDGHLIRGSRGAAGEIGLLLVLASGNGTVDAGRFGRARSRAPRGYAWIEELVGGGALREAAGIQRVLTTDAYRDVSLRPLADRAVEGWALIIADLMVLLDLQVVVLTGGLAADAAHLLAPLRGRVAELVAHAPEIRLGTLGPDAELIGADLIARAGLRSWPSAQPGAGPSAQRRGEPR